MRGTKVKGLECPNCGEFIPEEEQEPITGYQCSECGAVYKDKEEAQECCKD